MILLTNVYGPDYIQTQFVADEWSEAGFKVVVPDLFVGDPFSVNYRESNDPIPDNEDFEPWLSNHRVAVVKPLLERFVKGVRDDPETGKIGCIGFCWGARYVLLLANDDAPTKIDVGVTYHASFVNIEDVKAISKIPTAIIKGTADEMFSDQFLDQLEKELRPRLKDKLLVKNIPDAPHGFAVGKDSMSDLEKQWKNEVNEDGIAFVKKWFGAS